MLEGLPPNGAARLLRLVCDEATSRRAAELIVEFFDPAEIAASAFEDEASPDRRKPWILEIYLGGSLDEGAVRASLAQIVGEGGAARVVSERIGEQDWVAASLAGLAPVRAGRFVVHGQHGRAQVKSNDLGLEIEAALAFGTGHHGTTRGCLLALDRLLKQRRPRRVLDLGTGTGVLAMAAAKSLKLGVQCGDIDPVAVKAARDNARLNGVAAYVRPVVSPGLRHEALRLCGPYDLIFANILARPLRVMAPSIASVAAPGADLVLSGLLALDVPGMLSSFGAQGFALRHRVDLDGWATLELRRPSQTFRR